MSDWKNKHRREENTPSSKACFSIEMFSRSVISHSQSFANHKYKIGNHVCHSLLCKLHKCFDSDMSHSITVIPEASFIRDLRLIRYA